jgi:antitoxin (DNA-binding transcriptional repressor) of toxin-antitoxin stability system
MSRKVRIAELKARLSYFVRLAQRGQIVTVFDRDTPVARLGPLPARADDFIVVEPGSGTPPLRDFAFPPPIDIGLHVVKVLLAERGER